MNTGFCQLQYLRHSQHPEKFITCKKTKTKTPFYGNKASKSINVCSCLRAEWWLSSIFCEFVYLRAYFFNRLPTLDGEVIHTEKVLTKWEQHRFLSPICVFVCLLVTGLSGLCHKAPRTNQDLHLMRADGVICLFRQTTAPHTRSNHSHEW